MVEVVALLEGGDEGGVVRDLGQDTELDLGVVDYDERVPFLGHKTAPKFVLVRYLLDIRSSAVVDADLVDHEVRRFFHGKIVGLDLFAFVEHRDDVVVFYVAELSPSHVRDLDAIEASPSLERAVIVRKGFGSPRYASREHRGKLLLRIRAIFERRRSRVQLRVLATQHSFKVARRVVEFIPVFVMYGLSSDEML